MGLLGHSVLWTVQPPFYSPPIPDVEQYAATLLNDAEFRALELGTFLNSPTGEFVAGAVGQVVPPTLAPEFALLVNALKLAGDLQQRESRARAAIALVGGIAGGLLLRELAKPA